MTTKKSKAVAKAPKRTSAKKTVAKAVNSVTSAIKAVAKK